MSKIGQGPMLVSAAGLQSYPGSLLSHPWYVGPEAICHSWAGLLVWFPAVG